MVLRINHLDLSLMVLRINPADCGLRTLDLSLALRTGLNTPNGGCKEFAKKPPKPIKGEGTATNTKYKSKYKGAKNIAWNLNKELSCFCFRELRRRFLHSLHRIERETDIFLSDETTEPSYTQIERKPL